MPQRLANNRQLKFLNDPFTNGPNGPEISNACLGAFVCIDDEFHSSFHFESISIRGLRYKFMQVKES